MRQFNILTKYFVLRNNSKNNGFTYVVAKLSKFVGHLRGNNVSQSGQLDWEINDASVRDMHDRLQ